MIPGPLSYRDFRETGPRSENGFRKTGLHTPTKNSQKYPRGEWGLGGSLAGKRFLCFYVPPKPPKLSFPGGEARKRPQWEKRSRIIEGWLKD